MSKGAPSTITERLRSIGYVIIEDVLDPLIDLKPVLDDFEHVLERLATNLVAQGYAKSTKAGVPFERRLIDLTTECGRSLAQYFDISLPQTSDLYHAPINLSAAVLALITNPRLLDVVETVVGPEILVSPVGHVRMKLPEDTLAKATDTLMAKVPWHQDNGVLLEEADESEVLTVWIPLNNASPENGCLQVISMPGETRLWPHASTPQDGVHIPSGCVDESASIPLPMAAGSILLMHSRTLHSSLPNCTGGQVRISMDLRYQPPEQATGRPLFPSFLARSSVNGDGVLKDASQWVYLWEAARLALIKEEALLHFNRWKAVSGSCA